MAGVICSGSPAQPKPGYATTVVMAGSAIGALLTKVPVGWAVAFGMLVSGVTYDLANLCGDDPPTLPTLTGGDMVDLTVGPGGGPAYFTALAKFYTFVKYWAWYEFCECASVTTPAPASPPSAPSGLPQINPPVGGDITASPCWDTKVTFSVPIVTASGVGFINGNSLFAGTEVNVNHLTTGDPGKAKPIPAGANAVGFHIISSGTDPGPTFYFVFFNAAGASVAGGSSLDLTSAGPGTFDVARVNVPATAVSWEVFIAPYYGGGAAYQGSIWQLDIEATYYCAGAAPGSPRAECCPPDPIAAGLLTQILQAVTLIQRQAVPFSYVPSTVHSGLSGSGTLTISGLLGAKVDITTLPSQLGQSGTLPVEIFEAGFVTFGTPDGYPTSYRLEHDPQLMLPARCSAYTTLAYDLHPGVVVTITELQREP